MRDMIREQLAKEMTRKQFLQYMAGVLLMVFGLENIVSFLLRPRNVSNTVQAPAVIPSGEDLGFGTRRFGK